MTDITPEQQLGKWVRAERTARGWSQRRLADELKAKGFTLDPSAVTRLEKGQRPIRLNEAVALSDLLGLGGSLLADRGDLAVENTALRRTLASIRAALDGTAA